MRKAGSGILVIVAVILAAGSAQAAPTKVGALKAYDYTWMNGGYSLVGKVGSPNATCRKVKRTVILRNLTQRKNLGRGVAEPLARGGFYIDTRAVKGLVKRGDRIRIKVQRRKSGKVTCAAATKVVRINRVPRGGAG